MDSFVHLHTHTQHSKLDGHQSVPDALQAVLEQGAPAMGITDHGSLAGAYELWKHATAMGIKPIVGLEAYVAPDDRRGTHKVFWGSPEQRSDDVSGAGAYNHLTLIASDVDGLRALIRGSNRSTVEAYSEPTDKADAPHGQIMGIHRKPRWDLALLEEYAGHLIATTGCPSGAVQTRLRLGQYDEAVRAAGDLVDVLGKENVYLELMDHGLKIERVVRDDLLKIGRHLGLKLVATNDAHYTRYEQRTAHDHLLCINAGSHVADPSRFKFSGSGYHMRTPEQMRALFDWAPEACDHTLEIAERVGDYSEHFAHTRRLPRFPDVPAGMTSDAYLRQECHLEDPRYPASYVERAEMELGVIADLGASDYMLIVADVVRWAKNQGIGVGPGRGSAAGSLVARILGITQVNPITHGLYFERFLNPDRATMPDVDLDFADSRRAEVYAYLERRYGADHVAKSGTLGRIAAKGAMRDAARILDKPYALGDQLARALPEPVFGRSVKLSAIFDESDPQYPECEQARKIVDSDPEAKDVLDAALGLEGVVRQHSIHAAAAIVSDVPVADLVPLRYAKEEGAAKSAKKELSTAFTFEQLEDMGLLKIDLLGLSTISIIWEALDTVEALTGRRPTWQEISTVDEETLDVLRTGRTAEVFQMDNAARPFLAKLKPADFDDLVLATSITRPGPDQFKDEYLARRRGKPYTIIHPELHQALEPILGKTLGIIVYQEQLMKAAQLVAGYTATQADTLRRVMSKKKPDALALEEPRFLQGCQAKGYSEEAARTLWDVLLPFANYAFNLSHAVAYTQISVACAWLKAHHPVAFMIAALNAAGTKADKLTPILDEARAGGAAVLPPCVNRSSAHHTGEAGSVRLGLAGIKGVGKAAEKIAEIRGEVPFVSFLDYLNRAKADAFNTGKIKAMIQAGAFDVFAMSRRAMELVTDAAVKRERQLRNHKVPKHLTQEDLDALLTATVDDTDTDWDTYQRYQLERDALGVAFSDHPVAALEDIVEDRTRGFDQLPVDQVGMIAGLVVEVKAMVSKAKKKYALVIVEGADGSRVRAMGFDSERGDYRRRAMKEAVAGHLVRVRLKALDSGAGFINLIRAIDEGGQETSGPALRPAPVAEEEKAA